MDTPLDFAPAIDFAKLTATSVKTALEGSKLLGHLDHWWKRRRGRYHGVIDAIADEFGVDPEELHRYYIEPRCQDGNPADDDEDLASTRTRGFIFENLRTRLALTNIGGPTEGRRVLFVLSDAGMGKTSLLIMLRILNLAGVVGNGLTSHLMRLGPDSLTRIKDWKPKQKTILLLDALDEDPCANTNIVSRIEELVRATRGFRSVIVSCRTQFFPTFDELPRQPGRVRCGGYTLEIKYLAPFSDEQADAYLLKRFPAKTLLDNLKQWTFGSITHQHLAARKVVEQMHSLRLRPMLLAQIETLFDLDIAGLNEFAIYQKLVDVWLQRQEGKPDSELLAHDLRAVCSALAVEMQSKNVREVQESEIESAAIKVEFLRVLTKEDVRGRTLLTRNSEGRYRFSHYSMQEFLAAEAIFQGNVSNEHLARLRLSDLLVRFLRQRMSEGSNHNVLSQCIDVPTQVRGLLERAKSHLSKLSGHDMGLNEINLYHANLREADLSRSTLSGAILRHADLSGAKLANTDLQGADLRDANLVRATLDDANLKNANLEGASLNNASTARVITTGAKLARSFGAPISMWCNSLESMPELFIDPITGYEMHPVPANDSLASCYLIGAAPMTRIQLYHLLQHSSAVLPEKENAKPDKETEGWPVTGLSLAEAEAAAAAIGLRLPTEEEWRNAPDRVKLRTFSWNEQLKKYETRMMAEMDTLSGIPGARSERMWELTRNTTLLRVALQRTCTPSNIETVVVTQNSALLSRNLYERQTGLKVAKLQKRSWPILEDTGFRLVLKST